MTQAIYKTGDIVEVETLSAQQIKCLSDDELRHFASRYEASDYVTYRLICNEAKRRGIKLRIK